MSGKFRTKARRKMKRPSDVFRQCPECESPNLIKVEGDVFCSYCDWDSVAASSGVRMLEGFHSFDSTDERCSRDDREAAKAMRELSRVAEYDLEDSVA